MNSISGPPPTRLLWRWPNYYEKKQYYVVSLFGADHYTGASPWENLQLSPAIIMCLFAVTRPKIILEVGRLEGKYMYFFLLHFLKIPVFLCLHVSRLKIKKIFKKNGYTNNLGQGGGALLGRSGYMKHPNFILCHTVFQHRLRVMLCSPWSDCADAGCICQVVGFRMWEHRWFRCSDLLTR